MAQVKDYYLRMPLVIFHSILNNYKVYLVFIKSRFGLLAIRTS